MNEILKNYCEMRTRIAENHALMSDRALAFFQGVLWAYAQLDEVLMKDYNKLCELDERLQ